ncbi:MarR family transcriptional regulator [Methanosarcina sp. WWM596]|uniref:helix-turn-helix transcriptional regulator n=1 Tax=Methanosarcina sp. WWM596 TaxID=1434103 RepID=UPI00061592A5|nr:MarR family transcriptional regulator [Methanosarcina sp. WWM596]AKB19569.1 hypothetical protein MSWHS_2706 [Methanosarcina sp. WWM596]
MLAVGVLLLSSIVAIDLLLEDTPVVIQLEGDTFKVVDIPYVYTVKEAYILLFSGFMGGLALAQVLRSSGFQEPVFSISSPSAQAKFLNFTAENPQERNQERKFEVSSDSVGNFRGEGFQLNGATIDPTAVLLRVLEGDERKAVELIAAKDGKILQNELVNSLDFSKAKVSRVLMNLEKRGIITKKKYGLTNCISIADDLKDNTGMKDKGMEGE